MDFCFRKIFPRTPKFLVKAILNYFIGNYLTEDIDEDQIELIDDHAQCSNVHINIKAINDNFEKQNIPLNLLYGYIGCIRIYLPTRTSDGKLIIEVRDLELSIAPATRNATPDPNIVFGSMVDSMVFMQRSFQDDSFSDLIFEEKHKGKNFNALISKWISKLSVQFQNTKISFETQPIPQINRCCRFLCEIERINFSTIDTDSLNFDSTTLNGILLRNNIEFSGLSIRWEVAVQGSDNTSELTSISNSSNIILYGCQIVSVPSCIRMNYTLLITNSEPELEINFKMDTVHVLLAPLPIHWIEILAVQISCSENDSSISKNVKMTQSQFESFFPMEERLTNSFKSQNQESLYHSVFDSSSIQNTYDDVSLDNSDDDEQFQEFHNDSATCASISSSFSIFDDEGKMNTNFKATLLMKCFCMKILLQNPSNDFDTLEINDDPLTHKMMSSEKYKQWEYLSNKFFGLLKTVDKCPESFGSLEKFHKESGDINYLSLLLSNFMFSAVTKKLDDKLHRKFHMTTYNLQISETLYDKFHSRVQEDSFQIISVTASEKSYTNESNAIDIKIEHSTFKKELSFEVSLGKCYIAVDISFQDRIRLLTQNDMINYVSEKYGTSNDQTKYKDSGFNCLSVVNICEICVNVFVPVVNLNDEMHSKSYWKCRWLHPESLQLNMKRGRLMYRTIPDNTKTFHQDYIELYTKSVTVTFSSSTVDKLPILNIINELEDCSPIMIIKMKSKLSQSLEDREYSSLKNESFYSFNFPNFPKKKLYKPYSTKESTRNNSNSKFVHTPSDDSSINQYIENSINNSYCDIEVRASALLVLVTDKSILEIIYHRLAFDLLLWESNFDKRNNNVIISYKMEDDESDDEANTDTSYEEDLNVSKTKSVNKLLSKKFTLNMKIDEAKCYFQILFGHISETIIGLNQVNLFTDSDIVQGLVETQSMCIARVEKMKIFVSDHPIIDKKNNDQKLLEKNFVLNDNYFCVVDVVPDSLVFNNQGGRPTNMLVFIMDSQLSKYRKSKQNSKLKQKSSTILTAQINGLCLRHNFIQDSCNGFRWLMCLTDLLSLNNPVITGYVLPDTDTTMYLHLANCAMDLCFSHFPMAVMSTFNKIEIEMISNVTESYHLNIESCLIGSQIYVRSNNNTQLSSYFCWNNENWLPLSLEDYGFCYVADLDNLDLKFKKIGSTNNSDREPTCNLVITNSQINVFLCADSLNLIINCFSKIITSDIDTNTEEMNYSATVPLPVKPNSDSNYNQMESKRLLNESEKTQFNSMINDAIKDDGVSVKIKKKEDDEFCDGFLLVDDIFSNMHDRVVNLETSPNQKLSVVQDHYKIPLSDDLYFKKKKSIYRDPDGYPISHNSMVIHDFSISVHFYAGSDLNINGKTQQPCENFQISTRSREISSVKFQRFKSDNKSQISIQTSDTDSLQSDVSNSISRGTNRKLKESYQLKFRKINFRYALFSSMDWKNTVHQQISRRLVLTINDIALISNNVNSKINMVLFCDSNAKNWYDPNSPMVSFKTVFVQSNPAQDVVNEECDIKLSIQPIMLNVDQDFVLFVEQFYKDLNTKEILNIAITDPLNRQNSFSSIRSESPHQEKDSILIPPSKNINKELVLGRGGGLDSIAGSSPLSRASTIRLPAFDEMRTKKEDLENNPPVETSKSLSSIFIRRFSLYPDVYIRLDYTGTRLDFTQGAVKGLLCILIQLNNVVLIIKSKQYLEGITGFDVFLQILMKEIYDEFLAQINKFLTKVGPISEISEMLSGVYDFFSLPYQYYHNEKGIIEGIKLGTRSITTTSLWATLTLLSKGLKIFQKMAETTYDFVSPSSTHHDEESQHLARDFREGVTNAASGVRRRLNNTAQDMQVALQGSNRPIISRMGDVIRQVPPVIASPIVVTFEASSQLIDGLRYQLKPEMKIEDEKKWKF